MRQESDSLGSVDLQEWALWGAGTERARLNFGRSGRMVPIEIVHSLGLLKRACAEANRDLGKLGPELAFAIMEAAGEVASGKHDAHFPLDLFQTGSGTSTNMNVNEVVANRANEMLGSPRGARHPVHPNDHVNMGQSSNDAFPSALHVAVSIFARSNVLTELSRLREALLEKADMWRGVTKIGRTHLMDAMPVTMGQVFSGFAEQVSLGKGRVEAALGGLKFLAIGGSAVGTGVNTHAEFGKRVAAGLSASCEMPFLEAENHFEAQGAKDALLHFSGALRTVSVSLSKIANDIRLMASGPDCGLGELVLPEIQPGSSIMPGKVNPVTSEAVIQMSIRVVANDLAVSLSDFGGVGSILELNVAMPIVGDAVIESSRLIAESARLLREKLLSGLEVDEKRCAALAAESRMMATRLAPLIGYDEAARLVKRAAREGLTLKEAAAGLFPPEKLEAALDLKSMTVPG